MVLTLTREAGPLVTCPSLPSGSMSDLLRLHNPLSLRLSTTLTQWQVFPRVPQNSRGKPPLSAGSSWCWSIPPFVASVLCFHSDPQTLKFVLTKEGSATGHQPLCFLSFCVLKLFCGPISDSPPLHNYLSWLSLS
jgi:hypothetical protein